MLRHAATNAVAAASLRLSLVPPEIKSDRISHTDASPPLSPSLSFVAMPSMSMMNSSERNECKRDQNETVIWHLVSINVSHVIFDDGSFHD